MSRFRFCFLIGFISWVPGSYAGAQTASSIDFIDMPAEQMPNNLASDLDDSSALNLEDALEDFVLIPVREMPMAAQQKE